MSNQLTVTGKYLGASKIETVGKNDFTVRKFWVDMTTNIDWPNTPEFKLKGDKVNLVDNLQRGDMVEVKFNLNGRKWEKEGRSGVIVDLEAWKIDVVKKQSAATVGSRPAPAPASAPAPAPQPAPVAAPAGLPFAINEEDNDLPF